MHPTVVIGAYLRALDDVVALLENDISVPVDLDNREEMKKIVRSCIGTKLMKKWEDLAVQIALDVCASRVAHSAYRNRIGWCKCSI